MSRSSIFRMMTETTNWGWVDFYMHNASTNKVFVIFNWYQNSLYKLNMSIYFLYSYFLGWYTRYGMLNNCPLGTRRVQLIDYGPNMVYFYFASLISPSTLVVLGKKWEYSAQIGIWVMFFSLFAHFWAKYSIFWAMMEQSRYPSVFQFRSQNISVHNHVLIASFQSVIPPTHSFYVAQFFMFLIIWVDN